MMEAHGRHRQLFMPVTELRYPVMLRVVCAKCFDSNPTDILERDIAARISPWIRHCPVYINSFADRLRKTSTRSSSSFHFIFLSCQPLVVPSWQIYVPYHRLELLHFWSRVNFCPAILLFLKHRTSVPTCRSIPSMTLILQTGNGHWAIRAWRQVFVPADWGHRLSLRVVEYSSLGRSLQRTLRRLLVKPAV